MVILLQSKRTRFTPDKEEAHEEDNSKHGAPITLSLWMGYITLQVQCVTVFAEDHHLLQLFVVLSILNLSLFQIFLLGFSSF